MMIRVFLPWIAVLAGGCVECTFDLRDSVRLSVLDESGNPVEGASVECTVDGGEIESFEGLSGQYGCGQELDGDFEIVISKEGFRSQTLSFPVDADQCHVITESREVTLESLPTAGG